VRVELHCHSLRSDGTDPPRVVAERAWSSAVELFCLTDHDTWDGYDETLEVAGGMRVLRGAEISCDEGGRSVHLLVYGLQDGPGLDRLAAEVASLRRRRRERIVEICARFARWNIELDPQVVLSRAHGTAGRPHVAAALMEAGVVATVREAFDRFLHDGGPADVPGPRLPVLTAVELARGAGARISLAHPHSVGHPVHARALLLRAREAGLEGIEAFHGLYSARERDSWLELAAELDLVATAGSDYHGVTVVPEITRPGQEIPAPHADRLRAWLDLGS
jgi:predicted metal-dependent phosphoesterase TrpH